MSIGGMLTQHSPATHQSSIVLLRRRWCRANTEGPDMAAFDPTHSRVIWYSGGSAAGQWRECLRVPTMAEAEAQVAEIERGGRPAMIWHEQALPEGAPSWWDFGTLSRRMPREWEAPADDDATLDAREHAAERAAYIEEQEAEWLDAQGEG